MDEAGYAPLSITTTVKDDFASILDVPFVTVNRINGQMVAEVILSGDEIYDRLRLSRAFQAAAAHNQYAHAQVHGDYGNVTIYFSEYPNGGA